MTWLFMYLAGTFILWVGVTRITYKMKRDEPMFSVGDAATTGMLIAIFWPLVLVFGGTIFLTGFLFEGIGKLFTTGIGEKK